MAPSSLAFLAKRKVVSISSIKPFKFFPIFKKVPDNIILCFKSPITYYGICSANEYNHLYEVILNSNKTFLVDMIIVGIGASPNIELFKKKKILLNISDNLINQKMHTLELSNWLNFLKNQD